MSPSLSRPASYSIRRSCRKAPSSGLTGTPSWLVWEFLFCCRWYPFRSNGAGAAPPLRQQARPPLRPIHGPRDQRMSPPTYPSAPRPIRPLPHLLTHHQFCPPVPLPESPGSFPNYFRDSTGFTCLALLSSGPTFSFRSLCYYTNPTPAP